MVEIDARGRSCPEPVIMAKRALKENEEIDVLVDNPAFLFRKRYGEGCVLRPVPRSLSSSCGTAAFVEGEVSRELLEGAEAMYEKDGDVWRMIWKEQD